MSNIIRKRNKMILSFQTSKPSLLSIIEVNSRIALCFDLIVRNYNVIKYLIRKAIKLLNDPDNCNNNQNDGVIFCQSKLQKRLAKSELEVIVTTSIRPRIDT